MNEPKMLTMEEFKSMLGEMFDSKIREMGLDKIDVKHGIFPNAGDPNGESLKDLTKEQRVAKFLQAVVAGDNAVAKALSEGTAADGGYLVPTEFRAQVIEKLVKTAVIRPRATVIPMRRDVMDVPADANAVTTYWTAENTDFTEGNPTFGTVQLNTNMLTGLSKMSRQLFADSAIDIVSYIAGLFAKAFKKEEDAKFMAGSGSGQPKGIRTYTWTGYTAAQAGANLVADDIITMFYALPSQYRENASWLLHNDIIAKVRKLKDSQNRYLWTDGLNVAPNTLLGRPVLEQNDIPTNLGAGTNESEVYFGDLSAYIIGDREEMGVETTTVGAGTFEKHQLGMKVWERVDGKLGMLEAFRQLTAVK